MSARYSPLPVHTVADLLLLLYTTPMEDTHKINTIKTWLGSGSINIFGRPFAGKDTHGRELVELFGGTLLGGGDIIRNSDVPQHVKDLTEAGLLAPTEDYIRIVLPYLSKEEFAGQPLILSSVGRWHGEEPGVMGAAEASGHPVKAVLYLNIDETGVRERWQNKNNIGERGERSDDTEAALEIRLKEYREKTIPVIEYYREAELLIEIDSTLDKKTVLDLIIDQLYEKAIVS